MQSTSPSEFSGYELQNPLTAPKIPSKFRIKPEANHFFNKQTGANNKRGTLITLRSPPEVKRYPGTPRHNKPRKWFVESEGKNEEHWNKGKVMYLTPPTTPSTSRGRKQIYFPNIEGKPKKRGNLIKSPREASYYKYQN